VDERAKGLAMTFDLSPVFVAASFSLAVRMPSGEVESRMGGRLGASKKTGCFSQKMINVPIKGTLSLCEPLH